MQANTGVITVASTDTVGTTKVVTCGFQPSLVLFWATGQGSASDGITNQTARYGFGAATSTSVRYAMGTISTHAAATIDAGRASRSDACFVTVSAAGTADGLLDISSFDATGFTAVVDDQFPVNMAISYMAIGGAEITDIALGLTNVPTANVTGNWDTTGLSFQPDFLLLASNHLTSDPNTTSASRGFLSLGAATPSGQGAIAMGEGPESNATSLSKSYARGDEVLVFLSDTPSAVNFQAAFSSFLSNGFRLNITNGANSAYRVLYVAVKGGLWKVDNLLTQTDTVTTIVETGFGFTPAGTMLFSHNLAQSTAGTVQADGRLSIGAFTSASERNAQALLMEDGLANMDVTTALEADEVYVNISSASAVQGLMDVQSVDSGGFTLIMDDADPSQAFVWFFSFGNSAPSGVTATGIASGEAVGSPTVALGTPGSVTATGIKSGECVGTPAPYVNFAWSLAANGVPSHEVVGAATLGAAALSVLASSIASGERVTPATAALGVPGALSMTGTQSGERVGGADATNVVPAGISASGIPSGEVVKGATTSAAAIVAIPGPIPLDESVAAPIATLGTPGALSTTGVTSGEKIGAQAISLQAGYTLAPGGIAGNERVSAPITLLGVALQIQAVGIPSSEAAGGATLGATAISVLPGSVRTGELISSPVAALGVPGSISGSGVASTEALGSSTTTLGSALGLGATGIQSVSVIGVATIVIIPFGVTLTGVQSGEAVGGGALALQSAGQLQASAIASAAAVASPTLAKQSALQVAAAGIQTGESVGSSPTALGIPGAIVTTGIRTGERVGASQVEALILAVQVTGVPSSGGVGAATVTAIGLSIQATGISPRATVGAALAALASALEVVASGIAGEERVAGGVVFSNYVNPGSARSEEAIGAFVVSSAALVVVSGGIESKASVGAATLGSADSIISLAGIQSGAVVGAATTSLAGGLSIQAVGIQSDENLGSPILGANALALVMIGIMSKQKVGTSYVSSSYRGVENRTYYVEADDRTYVEADDRTYVGSYDRTYAVPVMDRVAFED